jgi:hypothetical protein
MLNLLLAVRKILAGLPEEERSLSVQDDTRLSRLFQHRFQMPFSAVNFGLCYTTDLFIARSKLPQNVVMISNNTVKISEALSLFLTRAVQVLKAYDGWACGVPDFEAKFTSCFGPLNVFEFGYSHVADLFDEFACDMSVIRPETGGTSLLLSLSEGKRLSSLEGSFVELLRSVPEQAVPESDLKTTFLKMFKTDLTPIVHLLKAKPASWSHLIKCFGEQTNLSVFTNQVSYLQNLR